MVMAWPMWFTDRIGLPDRISQAKQEIYKPVPQNVNGYADNFFSWVYDFNGDGWNDVFVVGFPGTPAYVYENPKPGRAWMRIGRNIRYSIGCRTNHRSW